MKYDSSIVGEKVINAAGKEGTIISVSRDGAVKVKFVGNAFDGEFMFDPFLSGHIKFANQELQKPIDHQYRSAHARDHPYLYIKIVIHEKSAKHCKSATQQIDIYFTHIGMLHAV